MAEADKFNIEQNGKLMNSPIEKEIASQLQQRFNEQNLTYEIREHPYYIKATLPRKKFLPYDLAVTINNKIVAIVECKSANQFSLFNIDTIETFARQNNIRFYVLTDGSKFKVTDLQSESRDSEYNFESFSLLFSALLKGEKKTDEIKESIAHILIDQLIKEETIALSNELRNEINIVVNQLDYDLINNTFSFRDSADFNSYENKLFRKLLNVEKKINKVYRYTTLDSLYSMLHYNSYRMNCLVGMNDTTEVSYAENYIYGSQVDIANAAWQTIDSYNRRFISSCTLLDDDLTLWRLYADDSKGVCLTFDVTEIDKSNDFILKKVSYANNNGIHPELEILKNIVASIRSTLSVNFIFKGFSIWKHFFKPYEYNVEDEVRLLFVERRGSKIKKDWLLTNSHKILNPFVEFILNEYPLPLKLTEIKFGPKCPEKGINQRQFEQYLRELRKDPKKKISLQNINCTLSKIKSYR